MDFLFHRRGRVQLVDQTLPSTIFKMSTANSSYQLLCIGNPLLDMQTSNGEALLEKYKLKANDAILASPEHVELYDEIAKAADLKYVAGGAAQNAARGAAVRCLHRCRAARPITSFATRFHSTFSRQSRSYTLDVSEMMIWLKNSARQMPERASKVHTLSSRASRLAHAVS